MRQLVLLSVFLVGAAVAAQQPVPVQPPAPAAPPAPLPIVAVKPIDPPATPLPTEAASAGVTRFSFIAYGDTRSGSTPGVPGDGQIVHPQHSALVDAMLAKARELAATPFPVRFVVQSGDAVLRGINGGMWNVSFTPIIEKLTRANIPYFFSVGNHDVSTRPAGDRDRQQGLHNTLTAMSKLMPPEGSPHRLNGYPTYGFGYGNMFVIAIDSNIAADPFQLAWASDQLDQLDRARYPHIVFFFHHPTFSSGPHGGDHVEPESVAIRELYTPLFRKHHVRMIIAGHDHLLDHWVERYEDAWRHVSPRRHRDRRRRRAALSIHERAGSHHISRRGSGTESPRRAPDEAGAGRSRQPASLHRDSGGRREAVAGSGRDRREAVRAVRWQGDDCARRSVS